MSPDPEQRSTDTDAEREATGAGVDPGRQTLLTMPSMSTGIDELPASARENLLVVSPWSPDRVADALREQGIPVENCGMVPISDSSVSDDSPLWTTDAVSPSDLTGLSMRYAEALSHVEPGTGWVLIDNAQMLLLYAEQRRAVRLLRRFTEQARDRGVSGVLAVDRGAVEMATLARLSSLTDTVVER